MSTFGEFSQLTNRLGQSSVPAASGNSSWYGNLLSGLGSIGSGLAGAGTYLGSKEGSNTLSGLASLGNMYTGYQTQQAAAKAADNQYALQDKYYNLAVGELADQKAQESDATDAMYAGFGQSNLNKKINPYTGLAATGTA